MRFAHHREPLLDRARAFAADHRIEIKTDIVVAHMPSEGMLAAAERHRAAALVMGWKGYANARDRLFGEIADRIIRLAPCDLMLLKLVGAGEMKTCLLPTAGGPNARLAASVLSVVAGRSGMSVTGAYVIREDADAQERQEGLDRVRETLELLDESIECQTRLIQAKSVAGGIAKASRDYDLLTIGAAKEPWFRRVLFGEIPERVARYSPTSVLVVKKYEGAIKSRLKRIMG